MREQMADGKAKNGDDEDVEMEDRGEADDAADRESVQEEEEGEEYELERDPTSGKLTGVGVIVSPEYTYYVRRFSLVMVQAEAHEYKFLGYVRSLKEAKDGDVEVNICWFYRFHDVKPSYPADMLICKARLQGQPDGGDKGRLKEIFFSNHVDTISIQSVMHPMKVWILPSMSLDPVTVPPLEPPAGGAAQAEEVLVTRPAAAAGGPGPVLLPGFICRRMYDIHTKEVYPLSEVPTRRRKLDAWLIDDVQELLRRSDAERREFMEEWLRRRQERAQNAQSERPEERDAK